ncbi:MAG: uroporphyrinogen-III C-methyltransferase [Pseudomonadota bacterium]
MTEERSTPETDSATPASPGAEKPARQPRPRGSGVAVLVTLVALAGAGGAGLLAWQQRQAIDLLSARLAGLDQTLNEQLARRATLDALAGLRKDMDILRQSLDARQQSLTQDTASRLDALRAELEALRSEASIQQQALDALRALTGRDERLWRLGEIERLLTAAQTRLRLLDDAATARLLLQEADRTATPLGGEALPLREAMQQATSGTNGARLDREGIALRLTQLAEALPELPRAEVRAEAAEAAPADGWWPRAKAWVGGWLHIERKEAVPAAGRDQAMLDAATRLLQARRALLARDTEQALSLVRQASETANTRLETGDARVRTALDDLADIAAELARPAPTMVDLTPAFTALRALRAAPGSVAPAAGTAQGD